MTEHKWQIGKFQIVLGSSSKTLKIVLVLLIVFSAAAMSALWWLQSNILRQMETMRRQAAALDYQNQLLEEKLDSMYTVNGMLQIAKEELDMVTPDTVLFQMQ